MKPRISLVMNTVRPNTAYEGASDWDVFGTVLEDLSKQTFHDFEMIFVDGWHERTGTHADFLRDDSEEHLWRFRGVSKHHQ